MMPNLTWNSTCFSVNGVPTPLICGEFHYFRVPKENWRERLLLLKESGANAAATYIPWIIHEPEEGNILFDDIPERSLTDFLKLCCELELMVIVRPGPYAYSELCRDGLPFWLADKYPQTLCHGPNGETAVGMYNVSYLHPVFLEKARRYIRAVDAAVRPFLVTNGGCVVMVQADNEIGGIHVWRNFMDCNAEAMGFGEADGYYVRFLREKYGTVSALNERYGTDFGDFTDILPYKNTPSEETLGGKRFVRDYHNFYKWSLEYYIQLLCGWFEEDGLDVDYCTNAGDPSFVPLLRDIPEQNRKHHFLLGVDHYYALFPASGISMTPEKAVKYQYALDMLDELGMPPSVLEMQSGSASCYPPMLPENLKGFYMTHVALGMKGSNYYVFAGGPNYANTGANTEIYDYHAPVSADGRVRPIYYAQKERNDFSNENSWLLTIPRSCDVQFGFDWNVAQETADGPWSRYSRDGLDLKAWRASLQLTLGLGGRLLRSREIGGQLDPEIPLIVVSDQRMAREKQEKLIRFVENGGKLILTPVVPELDEEFLPCTILRDRLGVTESRALSHLGPCVLESGEKVFEMKKKFAFPGFGGKVLCRNEADGQALIEQKTVGMGQVILMGVTYGYSQFCQMDLLETCIAALGCGRRIQTDCRHLMATLFEGADRAVCFLINNLAGAVTASLTVRANGREYGLENVTVPAMSVLPVELT